MCPEPRPASGIGDISPANRPYTRVASSLSPETVGCLQPSCLKYARDAASSRFVVDEVRRGCARGAHGPTGSSTIWLRTAQGMSEHFRDATKDRGEGPGPFSRWLGCRDSNPNYLIQSQPNRISPSIVPYHLGPSSADRRRSFYRRLLSRRDCSAFNWLSSSVWLSLGVAVPGQYKRDLHRGIRDDRVRVAGRRDASHDIQLAKGATPFMGGMPSVMSRPDERDARRYEARLTLPEARMAAT